MHARCSVVAATNRPNALDPALRRAGRLDRELHVLPPTEPQRLAILRQHTADMPLGADVQLSTLAMRSRGFTGADLAVLCREAAMAALSDEVARTRASDNDEHHASGSQAVSVACAGDACVNNEHWERAFVRVRPSLVRGMATEVAPLSWDDIGGLEVRDGIFVLPGWLDLYIAITKPIC